MIRFKGWVRTSLIDFPGHIATVLFTGGCNFRCPMCHNAELVLRPGELPDLPDEDVWDLLEKRVGKVTGVVITGGEPTLQPDLEAFVRRVRALGYDVKLDTNGYRPEALGSLLDEGLLDFVAMDVKAPPSKYGSLAGIADMEIERIEASIRRLNRSSVAVEYRTTVVPDLLDASDIEAIARWLSRLGGQRTAYVLQQFRGLKTLDPELADLSPLSRVTLEDGADRARAWLPDVALRGV